ncbi:PREDICTED: venom serine protease-like [Trachymyrmex septentrionalis]|uniref:venom serine protease-like n=1 Tax=Trachymyrmex septentrionalis TaxID=34720 RepID=UPI00084F7EE8|nr:PREDICTED: venom serine protease-like [Trachymyrmex septentrionalis]
MMEFCWKFYENIKEVKVLFGLVLSLLVLNGVEPNYYQVLNLKDGQTLYLGNNNCPNIWKVESEHNSIIKVTCYIDLNGNYTKNIFLFDNENSLYIECDQNIIAFERLNSDITMTFPSLFKCEIKTDTCQCCKKKVTRIVGGKETKVNEFPYMAGLVSMDEIEDEILCGATIISKQYVITAAHCVYEKNITKTAVVVGEHNVKTGKETNATKIYWLYECTIHPEYNVKEDDNDIAVCKTVKSIEYNAAVGPVCLPFQHKYDSFIDATVTALGWGLLEYAGKKSTALQKVNLQVVSPDKRSNRNDIMYTYTSGKDTCQFDSGGPLLWNDPNTGCIILVGTISAGTGCASNEPSINMRVGAFMDWIVYVTPGAQYCTVE